MHKLNILAALFLFALGCGDDIDPGMDTGTDASTRDGSADALSDAISDVPPDTMRRDPFVGPTGMTAGCGMAAETGLSDQTVDVNGREREYLLFVPSDYDGARPLSLIFAFHGLGDDAGSFQRAANVESVTRSDAIVVYPRGTVTAAGGARGWTLDEDGLDVPFADAMFEELSQTLCIDRARVFAAGFSNGAFLANALGCFRGDVFRAIAPISGAAGARAGCRGEVAVFLMHGTADGVVPFAAGRGTYNFWRSKNQCGTETRDLPITGCHERLGCDAGYPVRFCEHPGGHTPPSWFRQETWAFFDNL